jgi:hypothetical protein
MGLVAGESAPSTVIDMSVHNGILIGEGAPAGSSSQDIRLEGEFRVERSRRFEPYKP